MSTAESQSPLLINTPTNTDQRATDGGEGSWDFIERMFPNITASTAKQRPVTSYN